MALASPLAAHLDFKDMLAEHFGELQSRLGEIQSQIASAHEGAVRCAAVSRLAPFESESSSNDKTFGIADGCPEGAVSPADANMLPGETQDGSEESDDSSIIRVSPGEIQPNPPTSDGCDEMSFTAIVPDINQRGSLCSASTVSISGEASPNTGSSPRKLGSSHVPIRSTLCIPSEADPGANGVAMSPKRSTLCRQHERVRKAVSFCRSNDNVPASEIPADDYSPTSPASLQQTSLDLPGLVSSSYQAACDVLHNLSQRNSTASRHSEAASHRPSALSNRSSRQNSLASTRSILTMRTSVPDGSDEFEPYQTWRLTRAETTQRARFSSHRKSSESWRNMMMCSDDAEDLLEEELDGQTRIDQLLAPYILQINSAKRVSWDLIGCVLIFYDAVVIPLQVFEPPENAFTITARWLCRLFWTLDVLVSAFTGFTRADGRSELRFTRAILHYFRTWFVIDLVIVGISWFEAVADTDDVQNVAAARSAKGLKGLRVLRVVRLVRVFRLVTNTPDLFNSMQYLLKSEWLGILFSILRIMCILVMTTHCVTCCWYALGRGGDSRGWIAFYNVQELSLSGRYALSFHWALTLFVSNSEIFPKTEVEVVFSIVCVLFSFMGSVAAVSIITTSMTRLQIITSRDSGQLSVLRRYLRENGISNSLALRVQRNAHFMIQETQKVVTEDRVELFKHISTPLRIDIHYEIYAPSMKIHPFFKFYSGMNAPAMRQLCNTSISRMTLSRGDVLFTTGELPKTPFFYIVVAGRLTYIRPPQKPKTLTAGQWIAEPSLWCPWTHRGIMRAGTECRLQVVDAERFRLCADQFKSLHFYPAQYAAQFVDELNDVPRVGLSDIHEGKPDVERIANHVFPAEENKHPSRGSIIENANNALGIFKSLGHQRLSSPKTGVAQWFGKRTSGNARRTSTSSDESVGPFPVSLA